MTHVKMLCELTGHTTIYRNLWAACQLEHNCDERITTIQSTILQTSKVLHEKNKLSHILISIFSIFFKIGNWYTVIDSPPINPNFDQSKCHLLLPQIEECDISTRLPSTGPFGSGCRGDRNEEPQANAVPVSKMTGRQLALRSPPGSRVQYSRFQRKSLCSCF